MKAKIKKTGETIDVVPRINAKAQSSLNNLYVSNNRVYRECELDFVNVENIAIDWKQRRYEIAKAAMQGILSNDSSQEIAMDSVMPECRKYHIGIAKYAVACADALIEELKNNS